MATLTQHTTVNKSFYAHLYDQSGVLGKVGDRILFLADDNLELSVIEPSDVNFLVVLGQVDICDSQAVQDKLRGGASRICTTRAQEVA